MQRYEYRVVPAPRRLARGKARGADGRAAATLEAEIGAQAAEGWEYLRADTLPFDERSGLTQWTTVFRTMLVFRRAMAAATPAEPAPPALPPPADDPDAQADETDDRA